MQRGKVPACYLSSGAASPASSTTVAVRATTAASSAPYSSSSTSPSPSSSSPSSLSAFRAVPVPRLAVLESIVRVDHAGEYGAQCIYEGQLAALRLRSALAAPSSPLAFVASALQSAAPSSFSASPSHSPSQPHFERSIRVIEEMRDQEVEHLNGLSALIPRHRCRPTALLPLWHVAGYALGYGTALLGTRAAMACTVAVEEVITEHYNDQLRTLASDEWRQPGEQWDAAQQSEVSELRALIRKNRDDEEHHRDVGIEHEAQQTPFYNILTKAIKTGTQAAIAIAKRV